MNRANLTQKSILQQNKHRTVKSEKTSAIAGVFFLLNCFVVSRPTAKTIENTQVEADRIFTSERIGVELIDIVWIDRRRYSELRNSLLLIHIYSRDESN